MMSDSQLRHPGESRDPAQAPDWVPAFAGMTKIFVIAALITLAACGRKADLKPVDGTLPAAPYGAASTPTVETMLEPPPQAAPERVDDPIKRSEERREDRFELPPQ